MGRMMTLTDEPPTDQACEQPAMLHQVTLGCSLDRVHDTLRRSNVDIMYRPAALLLRGLWCCFDFTTEPLQKGQVDDRVYQACWVGRSQ